MYNFRELSFNDTENLGKNQINRLCAKSHINKIIKDLQDWNLVPPIIVNSVTNNIIDGQHRLEVYKTLINKNILPLDTKLRAIFVKIAPELEMEAIINANTHSKNWSLNDYVEAYIKNGSNSNYATLKMWCINHPLCCSNDKPKYRYGAAFFMGKNASKELKQGTLEMKYSLHMIELMYNFIKCLVDKYDLPTNAFLETLISKMYLIEDLNSFEKELEASEDKVLFIKEYMV